MIRAHYHAVKALLPPTVNAYLFEAGRDDDGKLSTPKFPYVVFWGDLGREASGDESGDSLDDVPSSLWLRVRATYAGLNGDSLMVVAGAVRRSLNRRTPAVEGRSCSKLRQDVLTEAQPDFSVSLDGGSHPVYAVDEFAFVSDPA